VSDAGFDDALGASYRLIEIVGRGAVGEVWRAVDRRTDEVVAAKLLRPEHVADRDLVARFVQERGVLTGLRDPNLVSVRDLVVEGDRLGIVMDFVDGGSLRELLATNGTLPPTRAIEIVAAVLDGLGAAHDKGLVHRDIKPDNVLLTERLATDADEEIHPGDVRLTDFGIARIVGEGPQTTTGLLGTPEYMSPELLEIGAAGLPADVYGVGIMLYELLAGRTPFAGPGTDYTIAHRHVSSTVPPLPIDHGLWAVLAEMLDKDPRSRPPARQAAYRLRHRLPGLVGVPALERQEAPAEFGTAHGPVTVVRGLSPDTPVTEQPVGEVTPLEDLDLGTPGQSTVVRPMKQPQRPVRPRAHAPEASRATPWWRDRRVLGGIAATVVLVAVVLFLVLKGGLPGHGGGTASADGGTQTATQTDKALPTGLTISRQATYDPSTHTAELSITYGAQNAAIAGPFLEVIEGVDSGECPTLAWQGASQSKNVPSITGIDTPCAWSVDPGSIPAQGEKTVVATISLPLGQSASASDDPAESPLQKWLDRGAAATAKAVGDTQITSTSYPAQRLQGVYVKVPPSTVTGKVVPVTLLPVWPSGTDKINALYSSPSIGTPWELLSQVAGGPGGVRFSDGCGGSLRISGHVVTALTVRSNCRVLAQVGNLTNLASDPFQITNRSS